MMTREMMIWDESYIGPNRRYRLRRLSGGTRSGMERRSALLMGSFMGEYIGDNRRERPRRSGMSRRIRKERRGQ